MNLAKTVALRSTCVKAQVGAIIVKDTNIISLGYNGSVAGARHCSEDGCIIEHGRCVRTLHAEVSAILNAGKNGTSVNGAKIYITHTPCFNCYRTIQQAGIKEAYYLKDYKLDYVQDMITKAGLTNALIKIDE